MKRTAILPAAIILIAALVSCKGNTVPNGAAKSETAQVEKSDTTEQSDEAVIPQIDYSKPENSFVISKQEPVDVPIYDSVICPIIAPDADTFFAMQTCAIKGTVRKVTEYLVEEYFYGEFENRFYMSVCEVEVEKVYGDAELNYIRDNVITLRTTQTSYDHIEWNLNAIEADGKQIVLSEVCEYVREGDEIVAFIKDANVDKNGFNDPELSEGIDAPLFDYTMICPAQSLFVKKADGMYSAFNFMAFFGKEEKESPFDDLEKLIKKNTDKLLNKSWRDVILKASDTVDET